MRARVETVKHQSGWQDCLSMLAIGTPTLAAHVSHRYAAFCTQTSHIDCTYVSTHAICLPGVNAVTVEDDDGFTRRVPNSFVVISERGQC